MNNFGPYDFVMDFALMSILLFIAQILRAKVRIIQKLYLPSSLIAGFLGLFLGNQFLDIIPFSGKISTYAYLLVVILFSTLAFGNNKSQSIKETMDKVGDTFALNLSAEVGAFAISLLIGTLVLGVVFPNLNEAFPLLQPAGFAGGHGYAAAIGGTVQEITGWSEAIIIGQTFATVGLLCGVFGGLIMINYAARKGYTNYISEVSSLPKRMQTGLIPINERESMGNNTIHSMSMESLSWHVALILMATAGGYYGSNFINDIIPTVDIPMICVAMLAGVAIQKTLNLFKLGTYVDKRVVNSIGSSITDYLVAFGIASIKISVVKSYAGPLIIMGAIGILYALFFVFVIGKRMFRDNWFERSIFVYGWCTGVVAMGVTLLRIVDPKLESGTLEDYGVAYMFISICEIGIVSLVPIFVSKGYILEVSFVLLILWFALLSFVGIKYKRTMENGYIS